MRGSRDFPRLRISGHPLVQDRLTRLRDPGLPRSRFRTLLEEIAGLLAYEITGDLPSVHQRLDTPNGPLDVLRVDHERTVCVPILRAGLGMLAPLLALLPGAAVGHVGVQRDPATKQPVEYFVRLPPDRNGPVLVVDPMIATGGSAAHTLDLLNRHGVPDSRIRFLALVTAPEGIGRLHDTHPEVPVFAAALDSHLNLAMEIVPGVGDVGNRLFGTL